MSEPKVINMVQCCYCGDEWCKESDELVCEGCEPALKIDLAIAEMIKATEELSNQNAHPKILERIDLLQSIHAKLTQTIRRVKPRKKKE